MSSGSFWRSPSIVTTTSARACSIPAAIAGCWPKLRLSSTTRKRASRVCAARSRAREPSVEPSSTSTTSQGLPHAVSATDSRSHQLVDVAGLVEDRHDDAHVGPRFAFVDGGRRHQHGLLFSGRRHPPRVPIFGRRRWARRSSSHYVETVWRRLWKPRTSAAARSGGLPAGGCVPGHAPRADVALPVVRRRDDVRELRARRPRRHRPVLRRRRSTRRGSCRRGSGATLIGAGIGPVTAMRLLAAAGQRRRRPSAAA